MAKRLAKSPNAEVRELTLSLSLKFGSQAALDDLSRQLQDTSLGLAKRKRALEALVEARDVRLPPVLPYWTMQRCSGRRFEGWLHLMRPGCRRRSLHVFQK